MHYSIYFQYATLSEEMTKCEDAIFENTRTCLRQPELFIGHVMHIEFIDLCVDNKELLLGLFIVVVLAIILITSPIYRIIYL
jgi:hypothetical protein